MKKKKLKLLFSFHLYCFNVPTFVWLARRRDPNPTTEISLVR
jgi:hypothetical protein